MPDTRDDEGEDMDTIWGQSNGVLREGQPWHDLGGEPTAAGKVRLDEEELRRLAVVARRIRRLALEAIHAGQSGHEGPSLSMAEILAVLFGRYRRSRPEYPYSRDPVVLSKGHGAPGLYAALAVLGEIPVTELVSLRRLGSRLQGHPSCVALPAVDFCTGSLGQGLSLAAGFALGARMRGWPHRSYCILGDGELQEGQNWEAAMSVAAQKLHSVTAIVDRNGLQGDGRTEDVMPLADLAAKWRGFGWQVAEVDGHDLGELDTALRAATADVTAPWVLIARTVKGKGVPFMEDSVEWHHHPLDAEHLTAALQAVDPEGEPELPTTVRSDRHGAGRQGVSL
jgi:transketolase